MKKAIFACMFALTILSGVETAFAREYRVLAIRVDFPYENPDHETTTGRGTFDLRDYYKDPETQSQYYHPWDIPPHDKRYFSNHLQALDTYLKTVSEDSVSIRYRILPEDPRLAYTMSNTFYKYGNGRTKQETYRKLAELFKEAVETCKKKEGASVSFTDFDTFMIIHAGMGKETSGGLNDIPSAYLNEEDFKTYPVMIDGVNIDNGIIVPEMASENGIAGLNGILAQMFGHRLGLPSLSNNKEGLPGAGGWALMDTGAMAYGYGTRGFIPTYPCIWSKIALGWLNPVVVTSDTTLDIAATHVPSTLPHGIKIPITRDEYLLIENRESYASRDSFPEAVFSDTDSSGVWMKVNHYDAFIPGSGILIWHINDRIIRENRAFDTINDDSYRRGVDLLEADGRQDIGAPFGFGDVRAEYGEGYDGDTYKLGGQNILSPTTEPHSGSMWGGNSGITVKVNSKPGDIMNVTVTFAAKTQSYPLLSSGVVTAADLNEDGADELVVSGKDSLRVIDTRTSRIFTAAASGHPAVLLGSSAVQTLLAAPIRNAVIFYGLSGSTLDQAAEIPLKTPDGSLFTTEGSILRTIVSSTEHLLLPVRSADGNRSYILDMTVGVLPSVSLSLISLPDTTHIQALAAAGEYIAALGDDNTLSIGSIGEKSLTRHSLPAGCSAGLLLADMDRNGEYEAVASIGRTLYVLRKDGSLKIVPLPDDPVGEPVAADIDLDGYPEILQSTMSRLCAFRAGGIPVDGFPRRLPPGDPGERIVSQPIVCDLDHDGRPDTAFATSNMRILSYDAFGKETVGFPVTAAGTAAGSPLVYKSSSGMAGLAYSTEEGLLCTRDLKVTITDNGAAWPMWRGGAGLSSSLLNSAIPSVVKSTAKFEAYCYPNPVTGGIGTFRITPEETPRATFLLVTVYSADGRKVFECRLPESQVIAGVPNEITMNTSKLASGLYIAKITTRTQTLIYKVGVIK